MVVRQELEIPSLGITVWHHSTSLVMPNNFPRDGIFNPHLTTIEDSYNLTIALRIHKFMSLATRKPVLCCLLSAFVVRCLGKINTNLAVNTKSNHQVVSIP